MDHDYIQSLLSYAKSSSADGIGGSVRSADGTNLPGRVMHLLEFSEWLGGNYKPHPCINFPSCNSLYRRSALIRQEGFPETIFPCEDTILNHRMAEAGFHLAFFPKRGVKHIHTRNWHEVIHHNYAHGLAYGYAAHRYKLPGYRFMELGTFLAFFLVVGGRFFRITWRLVTGIRPEILLWILALPFALLCLAAWAVGFINWEALGAAFEPDVET
jgi:GT2 family glycosyltransferase